MVGGAGRTRIDGTPQAAPAAPLPDLRGDAAGGAHQERDLAHLLDALVAHSLVWREPDVAAVRAAPPRTYASSRLSTRRSQLRIAPDHSWRAAGSTLRVIIW